jgi:hypothetical protein
MQTIKAFIATIVFVFLFLFSGLFSYGTSPRIIYDDWVGIVLTIIVFILTFIPMKCEFFPEERSVKKSR